MQIKIIQWNIKINSAPDKIVEFLSRRIIDNTIINLQEVSRNAYEHIIQEINCDATYSLNYRSPGKFEGINRKMGLMTLVNSGEIIKSELVKTSVFPERTLFSKIKIADVILNNLTFHSLTGVDYKKAKSSNFASLASFIDSHPIDIMTCDANEPKVDAINDEEIVFFDNRDKGKMASLLFGCNKIHNLKDTYKQYSIAHSQSLEAGYTHITGNNKKRYDHIYCRSNWKVLSSIVSYYESINASSDHGLVEAIVEIENNV